MSSFAGAVVQKVINGGTQMKCVIVESRHNAPTPEGVQENVEYLKKCLLDSLKRGESPYASHLFFTQFLDDKIPDERELGLQAGFAWHELSHHSAVYVDNGVSKGMLLGMQSAILKGKAVYLRSLERELYNVTLNALMNVGYITDELTTDRIADFLKSINIQVDTL
jgi:hypothetical protein